MYGNLAFETLVEKHIVYERELKKITKQASDTGTERNGAKMAYGIELENVNKEIDKRLSKIPVMDLIVTANGKISFKIL